jgi:hypothetical protein
MNDANLEYRFDRIEAMLTVLFIKVERFERKYLDNLPDIPLTDMAAEIAVVRLNQEVAQFQEIFHALDKASLTRGDT